MRHLPWLKLSILASSFALLSCKGTLPIRPKVDICFLSLQANACLCARPDETQYVLPFGEGGCDKYVAINPTQFNQLAEYVLKLEQLAHKQCGLKSTPASDAVNEMLSGLEVLGASRDAHD